MTDEKNKFDELKQGELKDVTGGIPYETPDLVELSSVNGTCGVGTLCSGGNGHDCTDGTTCSKGGGPSPDPQVP